MSEIPALLAARRRAMRLRRSSFPTPPRDRLRGSIMHAAFLPPWRESAVALLNAEHARLDGPPFDPATETGIDRANAGTEADSGAPGAPAREA